MLLTLVVKAFGLDKKNIRSGKNLKLLIAKSNDLHSNLIFFIEELMEQSRTLTLSTNNFVIAKSLLNGNILKNFIIFF